MRTLTLICSLLLAACGSLQKPAQPVEPDGQHPLGSGNDSSPIIIADGSIDVHHLKVRDHFTDKHPKKKEGIKQRLYHPITISSGCDPGPCSQTVDVSTAGSWILALCIGASRGPCNSPGNVVISWPGPSDTELMTLTIQPSDSTNFVYTGPTGPSGAKVSYTPTTDQHLQNATLIVDGITYPFTCTPTKGVECLRINYYCSDASNGCLDNPSSKK